MSRVVSFDTETEYSKEYSVRDLAPDRYTSDERFNCYLISVCDGEETWCGHPSKFNWDALNGALLVSHNASFDQACHRGMVKQGVAPKDLGLAGWHCSADLSAYCTSRRALADAVDFLYGIKLSKALRNYMSGKTWADAVREGKDKELIEYARKDAYWCWKIWTDLSPKWPAHERQLSVLNRESGHRGVRIDVDKLRQYTLACQAELINVELALPWRDSGRKPTSPIALAECCTRHGIPAPPVKSDDEEGFVEWETKYSPHFPWIKAVSDWRSVNKVLKTLQTIKIRLREDDTIEAPLRYFGAHTGRYSGDSGINFQNFRKDPLIANGVPVDVRALIVPRPGYKMIVSDLSQIEPRCLASLVGDHAFLRLASEGYSVYEAYGRSAMGWAGGNLKKERPDLYKLYKAQVLGLSYGCSHEKFVKVAKTLADLDVTPEESVKIVQQFREKNPKIIKLWAELDGAFKRSVSDRLFEVELPSGRSMRYPNVKRGIRIKQDPKTGKIIRESAVTADVGGRQTPLWGSKIVENITQATARDVFAFHLLELHKEGHRILFNVHDEVVLEVEPSVCAEDIEKIMSRVPPWLPGCPIAAESQEVPFYQK